MSEYNYYKSQLNRVNLYSEFPATIQIKDSEGYKCINEDGVSIEECKHESIRLTGKFETENLSCPCGFKIPF